MHKNTTFNERELREFGLIMGAVIAILFGLLVPWFRGHSLPKWPWIIALIFFTSSLLAPKSLKFIYYLWMRIGIILGFINTRIILGIIFYGLFMPTGLIMRVFKYDPMARTYNNLKTYRLPSQQKSKSSMENPY